MNPRNLETRNKTEARISSDAEGGVGGWVVVVVVEGCRRFVALGIAWLEWQKGPLLGLQAKNDLMEVRHAHMAKSLPH